MLEKKAFRGKSKARFPESTSRKSLINKNLREPEIGKSNFFSVVDQF